MKSPTTLFAATALLTLGVAQAQNPPERPDTSTTPDAASSPHQRETTGSTAGEASTSQGATPADASSPHQREATGTASSNSSSMKMAKAEEPATFVKKAAMAGMTEVELGKLALEQSQDDNVRKFAERMVKDHGKANTELAAIAQKKGLEVPQQLDAEHKAMVQQMSGKSGTGFDAAYAQHMSADHAKAVTLFEGGSQSSDADLSAFAKKTLPTVKEHKQMADSLNAKSRSAEAGAGAQRQ